MSKQIDNIGDASLQTAMLPISEIHTLPGGRSLTVHRLSWLDFEALWQLVSQSLAVLLLADAEITEERVAAELASTPQIAARLVELATDAEPAQIARWAFDDVLAAAAAAAHFNFVDSRGLRDFFGVVQQLAQPATDTGTAGR